jgi:hypothetical protein
MLAFVWFCGALGIVALAAIAWLKLTGRWHSF